MYQLIIIGGGPGGLTAGLYGGRANLKTLVIEKGLPGGQMQNTLEIDNYPGFPQATGSELSDLMYRQMQKFSAELIQGQVESVKFSEKEQTIFLTDQRVYKAPTLIIASGAQPRKLGVPGEKEFAGRGVSYCATCDGAFFRNRQVIVVGGGDSAVEEGMFLTNFASSVTLIHRRKQLRAAPSLQEKAFANPKMNFIWDSTVEEIVGDTKVAQVKVKNLVSGEVNSLDADGIFIYVGLLPNTGFLKDTDLLDDQGYISTDSRMATKYPGVFAIGDVRQTPLRQIVTATSDGAVAAMAAYNHLASL